MPVIYEYLGIKVGFFACEHEPIHVHAVYNGAKVRVILFVKDSDVYRVTYKEEEGKFNKAKLADLKAFISKNKSALLFAWLQFFKDKDPNKAKLKTIIITKKIK